MAITILLLVGVFAVVVVGLLATCIAVVALRLVVQRRRRQFQEDANDVREPLVVGFFHPYALAGGGGERVLWTAIRALHDGMPHCRIVVYFAWPAPELSVAAARKEAMRRAHEAFDIDVGDVPFEPVDIAWVVPLLEAKRYPRFTLALQAAGGAVAGVVAFVCRPCDIVVDTANTPFALLGPKVLRAATVAYVHYPTISADMVGVVARGEVAVNNDAKLAGWRGAAKIKLVYYRAFAAVYGAVGRWAVDEGVANSSWTADHLRTVWRREVRVVFPPCRVGAQLHGDEDAGEGKEALQREDGLVVSVGQFRPEKRHGDQVDIMRMVAGDASSESTGTLRLVMVGGARDAEDAQRAARLRVRAERERVPVEVRVDVSTGEMRRCLRRAVVGLHTMRHEHFGISVVELMMAGVVVVAHRSGGVERDIVEDGVNGFLAGDVAEFAEVLKKVLKMAGAEREAICARAKKSCLRFSEQEFAKAFVDVVDRASRRCRRG